MKSIGNYQVKGWERIFGGDLWVLHSLMRALLSALCALVPVKSWRDNVRESFDCWLIRRNQKKISYFLSHYPKVRSEVETLRTIVEKGCSIARFGDGEFNMCIGRDKSFQQYDDRLVTRLKEVLASDEPGLLIGINTIRSESDLALIWKKFIIRRGHRVMSLLDRARIYDSSTITTIFPSEPEALESHVDLLRSIWAGRKVVFVVGAKSRFFYEKELFDCIDQYEFVYGPAKNAFAQYDELINKVTTFDKNWLIMISLGPTATVMAHDLFKLGYQAIDLGQTPSKFRMAKYGERYPRDHIMYGQHK